MKEYFYEQVQKSRTHNNTYTQVGVQCIYESEVLNPSFVLLMKFSAKNPHLRVAAKRQAVKKLFDFGKNPVFEAYKLIP
jgi:hypothetical protein